MALGGIIAAGVVYALIGLVVMSVGYRWIERLMPPVVTGAVVAVIGLNLAPIAVKASRAAHFDDVDRHRDDPVPSAASRCPRAGTCAAPADPARRPRPVVRLYAILANGMGLGKPIDFAGDRCRRRGSGCRKFASPVWSAQAIALIAPVAIVPGRRESRPRESGRRDDRARTSTRMLGRAFVGDGSRPMRGRLRAAAPA